jgi:hypothetical protein
MRDLIERAEFAVWDNYPSPHIELVSELLAEVKRLRRKVRELDLSIVEEVAHLSADERAELTKLRNESWAQDAISDPEP